MVRKAWLVIVVLAVAALGRAEDAGGPQGEQPAAKAKRVVVIPIEGEINGITARAVQQRMERAKTEGVDIVVIRLDTPGGLLKAALDISEAIKSAEGIRTVAYVDKDAYSAGALIGIACNEIVIRIRGRIGDCAPILPGGKLEGTEREKAETLVRTEFRDSARLNGYNELLAQSMVSVRIGVYKIRHRQSGEIRYVDEREATKVSDYDIKSNRRSQKEWEYLKTVVGPNELLTMNYDEAKEYGFAKAVVSGEKEVLEYLGVRSWEVWGWDWGELATGFLNSMAVTGILMAVGLLSLYVALNSPGFGVPEVVAIACFAMIFGSKYLAGIAEWWTIALFFVGVLLLLVELLVLPGFGVAGVLGGLFVLVGLLGMVMPSDPGPLPWPETPVAWDMFWGFVVWMTLGFFIFVGGVILLAWYLPRIPKVGRLVLAEAPAATGVDAARPPDIAPGIEAGQVGVALGPLHPAGQARISEQSVDVVTQGELIDAGSEVEVVLREGNRIVVRRKT